jgi:inorganic triphosphatase YgiF
MTAESLWAAAGLGSTVDHDDALAPIFALDRTREIYLIEHGQIETGAEAALRLA